MKAPPTGSMAVPSSLRSAPGTASGGTGQTASPGTPRTSRLVARTRTLGPARSNRPTSSAHAPTRCSQLSRTTSNALSRTNSASRSSGEGRWAPGSPGSTSRPIDAATASTSRPGSPTAASSTSHTPSGKPPATRRANSTATLVLPAPPGPTTVTSRCSSTSLASSRSSRSRPTKLVSRSGRLWGGAAGASPGASRAGSWTSTRWWSRCNSGDGSIPNSSANTTRAA